MTIMHTSNAERMYYERNPKAKKERESLEDKNYRLSRMYNNCSCVISEIKNRTDYKKAQDLSILMQMKRIANWIFTD